MAITKQSAAFVVESVGLDPAGRAPVVTTLSDGRFVVVWQEDLSQPADGAQDTDGAIFARIYNANGTAATGAIAVNGWMPGLQDSPTVAATSDGGFTVAFHSTAVWGEDGVDVDSVMVRFDASGTLDPFTVADTVDPTVSIPVDYIDMSPDNPVDLSEEGSFIADLGNGLVAMVSNGATITIFDPTSVIDSPPSVQPGTGFMTAVARLEGGDIVIAGESGDGSVVLWMGNATLDGAPDGVVGVNAPVTFTTRKGMFGTDVRLTTLHPGTFAPNGDPEQSGFVVSSLEPTEGISTTLCLQTFTAWGAILSTRTITIDGISLLDETPGYDILALDDGTFVVSWTMRGNKGTDVMVGHYDADGTALGDPMLVQAKAAAGDQTHPSLTQLDNGRVLLVYSDLAENVINGSAEPIHAVYLTLSSASGGFPATAGNDDLRGTSAADAIDALGGNDQVRGNSGNDALYGGSGNDTLMGDSGNDAVQGQSGNDRLSGGFGNDGLSGSSGGDLLRGDAGNDALSGGADDDRLFGGSENDRLSGGDGNDTLDGGSGADIFVFRRGGGADQITGFGSDDVLRLDRGLWAADGVLTRDEVIANFGKVVSGDMVLTFDDGTSITLTDVTKLTGDDLQFV